MAFTNVSLTGNVEDLLGEAYATSGRARLKIELEASAPVLGDGDSLLRTGGRREVPVSDTGDVSVTDIVATTSGAPMYRLIVSSPDLTSATRRGNSVTSAWFEMAASRTLGSLTDSFDPGLVSAVTYDSVAALAAAVDADAAAVDADAAQVATDRAYVEGIVITDLGTTDGQTKALIESPTSETAGALNAAIVTTAVTMPIMAGPGIDKTGAADSTAAMQAVIDAAPLGADIFIPGGRYKFSQLTVHTGKRLRGAGWKASRDALGLFGDPSYLLTAHIKGTVLLSTATSGNAITVGVGDGTQSAALSDLVVVGPGAGTSTGIAVGGVGDAVVDAYWSNIRAYNFNVGIALRNNNECTFVNVGARGCTTGVTAGVDFNNNALTLLDVQRCVDGFKEIDTTCRANVFTAPVAQANTGTGFTVRGKSHTFISPYCEQNDVNAMDFVDAMHCAVIALRTAAPHPGATMLVQSGAWYNTFLSMNMLTNVLAVTNHGTGNYFQGALQALDDQGSLTRTMDLNVNTRDSGALQGTGSPEGVVTADIGVRYIDTNVTNGALEWTKMSGSGNTGWKVTTGDTGWRLVVAAGAFAGRTTSQVKVRRVNDLVQVQLYEAASGGAAGTHTLYDFGSTTAGFRAGSVGSPSICITNAGVVTAGSAFYMSGWLVVLNAASTAIHRAQLQYTTTDAWPTSLPGTATTP